VSTQLNIHGVPRDTYARLAFEEDGNEGVRWKTVQTPDVKIVFFPTPDEKVDETKTLPIPYEEVAF